MARSRASSSAGTVPSRISRWLYTNNCPTGTAVSARRPDSHPETVSADTRNCSARASWVSPSCSRMIRKT